MFLIDSLLMAPGKAVLFLFEELAKKARDEFLDDETVKQELQEVYAMLEAGKISEKDFEAREYRLVERLQQIALAKLQGIGEAPLPSVIDAMATPAIESPARPDIPMLPEVKFEPTYQAEPMVPEPAVLPELKFGPTYQAQPVVPETAILPELKFGPTNNDVEPAVPEPKAAPAYAAPAPAAPAALTMAQVIESATHGLSALKLKVSSITSVARAEDGWRVTAELVERRGVPDTSDLLGVYELQLDRGGNIVQYERTRMRRRCDLNR
jgi:Gas vesicle synthesis protein GvpO/Gas vesicle protein G